MGLDKYSHKECVRGARTMLARRRIFVHKRLVRLIVMYVWDQLAVRPPSAVSSGLRTHRIAVLASRPKRDVQAERLDEIYTEELMLRLENDLRYLPPKSRPLRKVPVMTPEQLSLAYRLEEAANARGAQEEVVLWRLVIEALRP